MKAEKEVFDMKVDFKDTSEWKGYPEYHLLEELPFTPVESKVTKYYKYFPRC